MAEKKLFVDTGEFSDLISDQLHGIKNIELLILKGHILIEYALNKYIDTLSEYYKSIEDTRFTFAHKLDICKLFGLLTSGENDKIEIQLILFNKLRNQIAHTLTYDEKHLQELIKYHPQEEEQFRNLKKKNKDLKILHGLIPWLCGNIIGRLEVKQRVKRNISIDEINKIKDELNLH